MILKINVKDYYGFQNRTKELFKRKYRSLGLKWMESVKLGDDIVDGWMNEDKTQYLLKLPEEGDFKRFTGNSQGMIEFLKSHGAVEVVGNEKGIHINYDDSKGFITQKDVFGSFIGADIISHYKVEHYLRNIPDNLGIKWSDKKIEVKLTGKIEEIKVEAVKKELIQTLRNGIMEIVTNKEMDEITENNKIKVLEIMKPPIKRRIIRRIRCQ